MPFYYLFIDNTNKVDSNKISEISLSNFKIKVLVFILSTSLLFFVIGGWHSAINVPVKDNNIDKIINQLNK